MNSHFIYHDIEHKHLLNISIYGNHIVVVIVAAVIVVFLLGLHYPRRISASQLVAIHILRYLSPINNPHLSYVILCIISQSTEYIRAHPSE